MVNKRLSQEEIQQISLRMKSARMLTGLTQETFAAENNISPTSIKCWEMGRSVPRKEGISSYLEALKKNGIDVGFEWVFYGSGPGPTYISGTQVSKVKPESDYIEQQIELFKKYQLSKGLNPIVTKVLDNSMLPHFKCGDVIGGFYVTIENIISQLPLNEIHEIPWLLMLKESYFVPRFLMIPENKGSIFYRTNIDAVIKDFSAPTIGKICWRYTGIDLSSIDPD